MRCVMQCLCYWGEVSGGLVHCRTRQQAARSSEWRPTPFLSTPALTGVGGGSLWWGMLLAMSPSAQARASTLQPSQAEWPLRPLLRAHSRSASHVCSCIASGGGFKGGTIVVTQLQQVNWGWAGSCHVCVDMLRHICAAAGMLLDYASLCLGNLQGCISNMRL